MAAVHAFTIMVNQSISRHGIYAFRSSWVISQ